MFRSIAFVTFSAAFALAVPAVAVGAAIPAEAVAVVPWAVVSASPATSAPAARAKVSGRLSETSFAASGVGSVKLTYSFSKHSQDFRYRLTFKHGSHWQIINSVKKTGGFKGSHTVTVKKLFAGQPVKVGSYRLKLTADGGSTTLTFTVTSVPPVAPPAVVKPQAGTWKSTSLSGPVSGGSLTVTSATFMVASDQVNVFGTGFGYRFSGFGCSSGFSGMTSDTSSPITKGQFILRPSGPWNGPVSGGLTGTFDSPTSAHGTGSASGSMWCKGPTGFNTLVSGTTGDFSWTAARVP